MNIVAADPHARVLSEDELLKLLAGPIVFRLAIGKTSHRAKVLRANRRAYFTVDQGGDTNGPVQQGTPRRASRHLAQPAARRMAGDP